MRKKILIVDDDQELRQLLSTYLRQNAYEALQLADTRQVDIYLEKYQPHLIVLDRMMPGEDGLTLCRRLRQRGETVPIIMLTARDETKDRVSGLQSGADDYLGKPFAPSELLARIEAVLRRHAVPIPAAPQIGAVSFGAAGEFVFDRAERTLRRLAQSHEAPVLLSSGEFALLNVLVKNAHRPLKRERLLELSKGDDSTADERSIDVQIHRLRRLIESDPAKPRIIQTVRGVGYVFVPGGTASVTP